MELHAALHAAPARFTTWDSRHQHGSVVDQHTDQLAMRRRRRFGSPVSQIGTHVPLRDRCRDPFADVEL